MSPGPCPKCGGAEIVWDVRVIDRGHASVDAGDLEVAVQAAPQAWLFKGQVKTKLSACVCAACGYTELYADDPRALAEAARKREEAAGSGGSAR